MDDSTEDIYCDTTLENSSHRKNDYINLSRHTIYHSAQDLPQKIMEEDTYTVKSNHPFSDGSIPNSPKSPRSCPKMFADGARRVDFVLAWATPATRTPLQVRAAEEARRRRAVFERHLEIEGLELEREKCERHTFVKIHAPHEVLCRYCEIMKLRMPMKELEGQDELMGSQFNLMTEVRSLLSKLTSCVKMDSSVFPQDKFVPSAEYSRDKSYLFDEEAEDFFSAAVRTLVVDFILERQSFSEDESDAQSVGIKKLLADGVYRAAYPLHDGDYRVPGSLRHLLFTEWAQVRKWIMYQPIDQVKEYFGVKFALYFAWLGFYTHMLIPAAIVGLACFVYGCFTIFNDTLSSDICDKSEDIIMCPRCNRTCDYWKLSDTCAFARVSYLFDNPVTLSCVCCSSDICDKSEDIIMCPRCDRTCDYWKLSDTCAFARVSYLFDNPVTLSCVCCSSDICDKLEDIIMCPRCDRTCDYWKLSDTCAFARVSYLFDNPVTLSCVCCSSDICDKSEDIIMCPRCDRTYDYWKLSDTCAFARVSYLFDNPVTLSCVCCSSDICDKSEDIIMCPRCDRTCDYWKLSDTCAFARVSYLFDNPVTVIFAVFMSFWATLFLELWKRYSASIAHRWGMTGYTAQSEHPRPQYLARLARMKYKKVRVNVVTGAKEPYPPFFRVRLPAMCFSFSVVLLLVCLAIAAVFGVVLYRMSMLTTLSLLDDNSLATKYSVIIIPATAATINLVCIMIFNYIYDMLAVYLTEMELLRTQSEFDDSLTVKIYLFQFVNYYTSIMYIAFLKGKFVGYPAKYNRIFGYRQEECNPGGCLMELCIQLAIIMVGQQAFNSVLEMVLPFLYKWYNTLMLATGLEQGDSEDDVVDAAGSKQWTEDYKLLDWGDRGLFYEYLEMVMQYGFVTIFVSAFPLAPVFALINNVLEMRLDARKFLMFYRRPVPLRASNIGIWFRILDVLSKLAVISNAFIIAFSSNFIPRLVYMISVNPDHNDQGFLNFSLAYFNTSDFQHNAAPVSPSFNVSICRYPELREPPWAPRKYKRPDIYWRILAARLGFVVVFQNLVSLVMIAVQWCIPDMSPKLRDQIKREAFLTSEMIIKQETLRARIQRGDSPVNISNDLNNSSLRRRREAKKGEGEGEEPSNTIEMDTIDPLV